MGIYWFLKISSIINFSDIYISSCRNFKTVSHLQHPGLDLIVLILTEISFKWSPYELSASNELNVPMTPPQIPGICFHHPQSSTYRLPCQFPSVISQLIQKHRRTRKPCCSNLVDPGVPIPSRLPAIAQKVYQIKLVIHLVYTARYDEEMSQHF